MPLNRYHSGSGDKVMQKMKARYGKTEGRRIFYARAKKAERQTHRKG